MGNEPEPAELPDRIEQALINAFLGTAESIAQTDMHQAAYSAESILCILSGFGIEASVEEIGRALTRLIRSGKAEVRIREGCMYFCIQIP